MPASTQLAFTIAYDKVSSEDEDEEEEAEEEEQPEQDTAATVESRQAPVATLNRKF